MGAPKTQDLESRETSEMTEWWLSCGRCGSRFEIGPLIFGCPACAREDVLSVLEAGCNPRVTPAAPDARRGPKDLRGYLDLLPGGDADGWVSLGEGGTALVRSRIIGRKLGIPNLYFKNETTNPTWSFKDRYVAVTVNVGRMLGYRRAVVSSTGNLGVSAAAYCAAAGMDCLFLAQPGTSRPIIEQAHLHGAHVLLLDRDDRQQVLEYLPRHRGWFPIGLFLSRSVNNPFGVEGYKTFAYEMIEDLGAPPAAVLFPCARGNGLYGAWKGFMEAEKWGWAEGLPAMVACQPTGANSLEVSLERRLDHAVELPPVESVAFSTNETVADDHALRAIRESGGAALSVGDEEILQATRDLGREGLYVEPSSALPVACLRQLMERLDFGPADAVVCVLTAAGVRWPGQMNTGKSPLPEIKGVPEEVDRYLQALGLAY